MPARPRVHEFDVAVDEERAAHSALGGSPLPADEEWWPEHYVLAGLLRCTLASMDYTVRRSGSSATGSGTAHGVVTKREEDGRYAFVEINASLYVQLTPALAADVLLEFVRRSEVGCFIGNSLSVEPHDHWTINGEPIG